MMQEDGEQIGRFKVRCLMRELELVSKQPGSHAYKQATVERPDIPNILNREFDVPAPNQVWCGDITYIWAQGKWHYLAVVMDLYASRVVGWALSNKPDADLGHQGVGHGLRTAWQASRTSVSLGSGLAIWQPPVSPTALALPHAPKHEPSWELLGQCGDGACVPQLDRKSVV